MSACVIFKVIKLLTFHCIEVKSLTYKSTFTFEKLQVSYSYKN